MFAVSIYDQLIIPGKCEDAMRFVERVCPEFLIDVFTRRFINYDFFFRRRVHIFR